MVHQPILSILTDNSQPGLKRRSLFIPEIRSHDTFPRYKAITPIQPRSGVPARFTERPDVFIYRRNCNCSKFRIVDAPTLALFNEKQGQVLAIIHTDGLF